MKSKLESGFTAIETVFVLTILAVISTASLWVWHVNSQHVKTSAAQKITNGKTYTDSARVYQLTYPSSWRVVMNSSDNNMGIATDASFPTFIPSNPTIPSCNTAGGCSQDSANGFVVSSYKQSNPDSVFKSGWSPMKKEIINGYTAYYKKSFGIMDNFFVVHDGYLLDFSFMEKNPGAFNSFDDSRHVPSFNSLVHTIKFLK